MRIYVGVFAAVLMQTGVVSAKEAAPMAIDPVMEEQVNKISAELRCLVCQNQTIADSHAELAIDLKNQVREMVKAGKSQDDVVEYMVTRYGDFVLYRPPVKKTTYLLWAGPFVLFVIGVAVLMFNLKKRRAAVAADAPLSAEDSERLKSILGRGQEEAKS